MPSVSEFTWQSLDKWALWMLFSALFLNKNSMLGHENCSCPKKKCHWSQSTLATCAAVNEPTFSDNKHFHRKIPPQFSMMSTNLFLLQVPRAAPRVSNTQTVAGKAAAAVGLVHGSNLALSYWYMSVTPLLLLTCTSGECAQRSLNLSNITWIIFMSRSDQTEEPRISGGIFLHLVLFSLYYNWFLCGLPLFISFLKEASLWGHHATDHRQLKSFPGMVLLSGCEKWHRAEPCLFLHW